MASILLNNYFLLFFTIERGSEVFMHQLRDAKINRAIRNAIWCIGGHSIKHMDIKADSPDLFLPDGMHLTSTGNNLLLWDVRQGLEGWIADIC